MVPVSTHRDRPVAQVSRRGAPAPRQPWRAAGQPVARSWALRPYRPTTTRLELVPAGRIDVQADPWQRLVAVGSILSVLIVAIGLYLTNEANRDQQRLAAQGQITDRYTTAIEQLGQPGAAKVDVRLGAIYALERIMRDSAADQPAVVEILAAFIRLHAPAPNRAMTVPSPFRPSQDWATQPQTPVDIQTALTVLSRRDDTRDGTIGGLDDPSPRRLNLAGADLSGANLSGANLLRANLRRAYLLGAELGNAKLANADLSEAQLRTTKLSHANLRDAALLNADLGEADLVDADLRGAFLGRAFLGRAYLFRANLSGADLSDADLRGARLIGADLRGANLHNTRLECALTDDSTLWPEGFARPGLCS